MKIDIADALKTELLSRRDYVKYGSYGHDKTDEEKEFATKVLDTLIEIL